MTHHDTTLTEPDLRVVGVGALTIGAGVALVVWGPQPLPLWFAAMAIVLRLTSSGQYAVAVVRAAPVRTS